MDTGQFHKFNFILVPRNERATEAGFNKFPLATKVPVRAEKTPIAVFLALLLARKRSWFISAMPVKHSNTRTGTRNDIRGCQKKTSTESRAALFKIPTPQHLSYPCLVKTE